MGKGSGGPRGQVKLTGGGTSKTPIGCADCCTLMYCDHQDRRVGDNGDSDTDCVCGVRGRRAGHAQQEGDPGFHAYNGEQTKCKQREILSPTRYLQSVEGFDNRRKSGGTEGISIKEHGSGGESYRTAKFRT